MIAHPENPASWLKRFQLQHPVVSCDSAASAKGIPLEHELKSLLVTCDRGHILAHVRGNQRLSLRTVKSSLGVQQAKLAEATELHALEVSPGTINPFESALWPMPHLIERSVLGLPWVTTNAGDHHTYVVFDPCILLRAKSVALGPFGD